MYSGNAVHVGYFVIMVGKCKVRQGMKKLVIGILAHVDAGKTTLSEGMLYVSGAIKKLGRVDYGDAFLDTYELERARGITIFSKQAMFHVGDMEITLLDTPGHVDFAAEMERTLQVLDYAVLVINGADGVQSHTRTLWRLLRRYEIPTFLFMNKMDQEGTNPNTLLEDIKNKLSEKCVDFTGQDNPEEWLENVAMCHENLLEQYLETGEISEMTIREYIAKGHIYPCYFGSALKLTGVQEFLQGLGQYTKAPAYPEAFGAKVYKIARDEQGNRLTYMKITGGSLKVKEVLAGKNLDSAAGRAGMQGEKADQIRVYSGTKYEAVQEAEAGSVCAATGLHHTYAGQGLGRESESELPILEPVLTYRIHLPEGCDVHGMLLKLRQLEEEEPLLHIVWNEALQEIHVQLMGEVQIEILKSLIQGRFGIAVEFGQGNIVYKETIAGTVEGVGHYEPLRHYAEVHLKLEPTEPGSGLQFASACSEDILDKNWQRLILTHLEEKEHKGVLTGSPITDMKITIVSGKAHQKHTEGGDFRQATYRAVRHGLKRAESVLLEPYYDFRLEVPAETVGRALTDIQRMSGSFEPPRQEGEMSVITGSAPVASMQEYQKEVIAYTKGKGRLSCTLKGYEPCHNAEEVIETVGYDSERDLEAPTGSVFCAHGAGFVVPWEQVEQYMHISYQPETVGRLTGQSTETVDKQRKKKEASGQTPSYGQLDKELEAIFTRTYGEIKRPLPQSGERVRTYTPTEKEYVYKPRPKQEEVLLVDGYNIIFAWEDLKELAAVNMDSARGKLLDILSNYQGYRKCSLTVVFDAYRVEGHQGEEFDYHNIHVVYTKEGQIADRYIEQKVQQIGKKLSVVVATSDGLEQAIIFGQGGRRLSAAGLREEIEAANTEIRTYLST